MAKIRRTIYSPTYLDSLDAMGALVYSWDYHIRSWSGCLHSFTSHKDKSLQTLLSWGRDSMDFPHLVPSFLPPYYFSVNLLTLSKLLAELQPPKPSSNCPPVRTQPLHQRISWCSSDNFLQPQSCSNLMQLSIFMHIPSVCENELTSSVKILFFYQSGYSWYAAC